MRTDFSTVVNLLTSSEAKLGVPQGASCRFPRRPMDSDDNVFPPEIEQLMDDCDRVAGESVTLAHSRRLKPTVYA